MLKDAYTYIKLANKYAKEGNRLGAVGYKVLAESTMEDYIEFRAGLLADLQDKI